ncbi:tartrate dehydrogenase [Hymenobacter algoricola]|uniref:D-malate dehydrogenase (decarboxylating) n=1 Tax=Hymenobacter algoricola TaxID=486267 RepID=A0ABP7MRW7_9BACT
MKTINLAVFPADGIGPEVIAASQQVLHRLAQLHGGVSFECREFDWSSAYYHKTGRMMPADGLQQLEAGGFDAILMGPVGSPAIPDHITLWGLLLTIRQGFDQYVNLRPMRLLAGVVSPLLNPHRHPISMVCIRENSEGEYAGVGGRVHQGKPGEVAIQSIVFTRRVTERVMRFAFDYARQHGHRLVTNVTKSNSMQHNMVFWDEVFQQVAAHYPAVATDQQLVDSMTARMVSQPETVDVFVASNLFGDILSDLGAALTGSMGLAPSANLNPERHYPSLFQAIHGSAFGLVGKNVANPLASIWSAQLMLAFLGETELATRLMSAIETVVQDQRVRTPDLGGTSSTTEMTEAVCRALETEPTAATGH